MNPVSPAAELVGQAEIGPRGLAARSVRRWMRPVAVGLAALGFLFFAYLVWFQLTDPRTNWVVGFDRAIYDGAIRRLLATGEWFYPEQLAGPYIAAVGHVMYPPVVIPLLALTLPWPIWYAVPIAVTVGVVLYHRPSAWGWAGIAACLAYPPSSEHILSGNPALWAIAACALGTVWRPAFALVLLKPALFPFALFGVRSRGWWVLVAIGAVASLVVLPWTVQWFSVVLDARGGFSGPLYATRDIGLMLVPLVAWWSHLRDADEGGHRVAIATSPAANGPGPRIDGGSDRVGV